MASQVRHLLHRNGRYYARIRVPDLLREIVGKRELTKALDADRSIALRLLPSAVHAMQIQLDEARDRATALSVPVFSKRRPLSIHVAASDRRAAGRPSLSVRRRLGGRRPGTAR